jgi:AraC-like DNA-binding protein
MSAIESLFSDTLRYTCFESSFHKKVQAGPLSVLRVFPFIVIVRVKKGEFTCQLMDKTTIYSAHADETLVVLPNVPHKIRIVQDTALSYIHIHYTAFGSFDFISLYSVPIILKAPQSKELNPIIDAFAKHFQGEVDSENKFNNIIRKNALAFQLLSQILVFSELKSDNIHSVIRVEKMAKVLDYIEDHIDKNITRNELASLISLSPTRFHYVFKEAIGMSPLHYVQNQKMQKAQNLLISTDLSIQEIAFKVGISDIFYFSRQFKKFTKYAPSQYRRIQTFKIYDMPKI